MYFVRHFDDAIAEQLPYTKPTASNVVDISTDGPFFTNVMTEYQDAISDAIGKLARLYLASKPS